MFSNEISDIVCRDPQIVKKSANLLKIPGIRRVTWSQFHAEQLSQILGATVHILGDLAPGVSTTLVLCNLLIRLVAFFTRRRKVFLHIVWNLKRHSGGNILALWGHFGRFFWQWSKFGGRWPSPTLCRCGTLRNGRCHYWRLQYRVR